MDRHVLENRRKMLDQYLKALLEPAILESNLGLIILMNRFLDQVLVTLSFTYRYTVGIWTANLFGIQMVQNNSRVERLIFQVIAWITK